MGAHSFPHLIQVLDHDLILPQLSFHYESKCMLIVKIKTQRKSRPIRLQCNTFLDGPLTTDRTSVPKLVSWVIGSQYYFFKTPWIVDLFSLPRASDLEAQRKGIVGCRWVGGSPGSLSLLWPLRNSMTVELLFRLFELLLDVCDMRSWKTWILRSL